MQKRLNSIRISLLVTLIASITAGCGGSAETDGAPVVTASVTGNVFVFPFGKNLPDAEITILELPGQSCITDEDGGFRFDGLEQGSEVTFVMNHPQYPRAQTATFALGSENLEEVTFQVPGFLIYNFLAFILQEQPTDNRCQIVSTVTEKGKSLYNAWLRHGVEGATVHISPELPESRGPVYFNDLVLPDRSRTETSVDGGVIFVNVPPGDYQLTATKEGHSFSAARIKCTPGTLVNASPPWGLQEN
jgi:hypothetical protein